MNFYFSYKSVTLLYLPKGRPVVSASVGELDCDFNRESQFPNLDRKSCGHTFKTLVGFSYSLSSVSDFSFAVPSGLHYKGVDYIDLC